MDIWSNCYDKIDTAEADTYAAYDNPDDISCKSEHIASLLNFIPTNYKGMTSEEQLRPSTHQIVLAQAFTKMKEERDLAMKKQKKAERGKATIFGWNIMEMTSQMKLIYTALVIAIFAAVFWYLYKKVAEKEGNGKRKDKKKK